jgi:hypothetical protein
MTPTFSILQQKITEGKRKQCAKLLRFLRYLLFKKSEYKEFEQKHAKQTKDIPTSPFQF